MKAFTTRLCHWAQDDKGATAIEYGLIAAIMGVALIPIMTNLSSAVSAGFTQIAGLFALV